MPGLQLSRSGRDKSTFIIRCSVEGFEAAAVLGAPQFPYQVTIGKPLRATVDMTDATLDQMLEAWRGGHQFKLPALHDPANLDRTDWPRQETVRAGERAERKAAAIATRGKPGGKNDVHEES